MRSGRQARGVEYSGRRFSSSLAMTQTTSSAPHSTASLRLMKLARPHLALLLLAVICALISTAAFLIVPYTIRLLTDSVFVHHNGSDLNRIALLLLAAIAASALFSFIRSYTLSYIGGRIVADLRLR